MLTNTGSLHLSKEERELENPRHSDVLGILVKAFVYWSSWQVVVAQCFLRVPSVWNFYVGICTVAVQYVCLGILLFSTQVLVVRLFAVQFYLQWSVSS